MPPQSCLTSSTVYFARLRSRVGLVSTCFDTFSSILLSHANLIVHGVLQKMDLRQICCGISPAILRSPSTRFRGFNINPSEFHHFNRRAKALSGTRFHFDLRSAKMGLFAGILSVVRKTNRRVHFVIGNVGDHLSENRAALSVVRNTATIRKGFPQTGRLGSSLSPSEAW